MSTSSPDLLPGSPVVQVSDLDFRYTPADPPALRGITLRLDKGQRVLLVGANGAGKTTLLRVLAGRHMIPREQVRVLGRPAFHDPSLAGDVTFIGGPFPVTLDVVVEDMMRHREAASTPARRDRLLQVLGVDPGWHMHRISDGQRRRVQILLHLLGPSRLLLLDEVTTDLDVLVRAELLDLLREDTERLGTTLLYATHIFDGLEDWASHLAAMDAGRVVRMDRLPSAPGLAELRAAGAPSPLYRLVSTWLREGVPPS